MQTQETILVLFLWAIWILTAIHDICSCDRALKHFMITMGKGQSNSLSAIQAMFKQGRAWKQVLALSFLLREGIVPLIISCTNNNCNQEDYSMNDSIAAPGKLGGSESVILILYPTRSYSNNLHRMGITPVVGK